MHVAVVLKKKKKEKGNAGMQILPYSTTWEY